MNAEICYLTRNGSYTDPERIEKPRGVLLHSTGADNPRLCRYVQPSGEDAEAERLLRLLGVNKYGNSWNRPSVKKSVHYFIGKYADGTVGCVQTLPTGLCCWGCGRGKKGSYNYNPTAHIQIEVCEDDLTDAAYFDTVYRTAVKLCADLCRDFGFSAEQVVSHREAYLRGYASNHGDIDRWLKKFGRTMKGLRQEVERELHPYFSYTVKKGDTLSKIAKKYKTTVERIVSLNCDKYPTLALNPNRIMAGWTLLLDRTAGET